MPLIRENGVPLSEGDQTWLGSTRGITKNRTEKLDVSAFTPTDGFIPSGTPVAFASAPTKDDHSMLVPYDPEGTAGTAQHAILEGFLFTDQAVYAGQTEDINVPVLDHGRIIRHRLPVSGFVAPAPDKTNGNFVFEA